MHHVLQVLKDVFNPWFHAYRLLVQCAANQEVKLGVPFRQDAARALASTNTMDRWILAAANGESRPPLANRGGHPACCRADTPRVAGRTPHVLQRCTLCVAGLLAFVRQEMEAYRLYTVVPRLVHMIDELTNWYVRMNKERFAGERGDDERADALSTLFEVRLPCSCC